MKLVVTEAVPKLSVGYVFPILVNHTPVVVPEFTGVFPAARVRLDELNSFVLTPDGTVHRLLYCSPSYFAGDYVVKPIYA